MEELPEEKVVGTYGRIVCADCSNEQIVFLRAATPVSCHVCGTHLAEPAGGLATLKGELKEYVD